MEIVVLRYGHRHIRDYRVTTHCCLVSRAFNAKKTIICGEPDEEIKKNIEKINKNWGSNFKIEFTDSWKKTIKEYKQQKYKIIHNTMYGECIQKKIKELKKIKKIMIVIGSHKVEPEVYNLSDYNISITTQPHSEIASLAITLHELQEGKELKQKFKGKIKIIPSKKGKKIKNQT
jgi:tRNA (cytidine56-2'-O)-methyltransferase